MSKVIGIVCEFNPFHKGHEYLIKKAREQAGEPCTIVCVMSGDFVQRGEPAIYQKSARAEAAVRCGADLVAELPVHWSLSSAEGFARGAVSLLSNLGATHICFGSEAGNSIPLKNIAEALIKPEITEEIKSLMAAQPNLTFPTARELILKNHIGEQAELIRYPNNILGVEYIKSVYELGLDMEIMTVKREGIGHDEEGEGIYKSSSELRKHILSNTDVSEFIPQDALNVYNKEDTEGRGRINAEKLEQAIISRLRMLPKEAYQNLPDSSDGAGDRLYKAATEEASIDDILNCAKTKRYTMARLRRMVMCAALGIDKEQYKKLPNYARILAANETGCALLRKLNDDNKFTIITKPAKVRKLSCEINKVFAAGVYAHDLYVLGNKSKSERTGGQDWKIGPVIVQNSK